MTYYQIEALGVRFAAYHTREMAEYDAKQFMSPSIHEVTEDTPGFIPPVYDYNHEVTLLGLACEIDGIELRCCSNCGLPMKKGYYLGGEYACCDECALDLYNGDKKQMEEDLSHAFDNDAECYYTEWESFYFD